MRFLSASLALALAGGATLEQAKAARVTADYDDRYGAISGAWTTDLFVDAVYTSLKNPPARFRK